MWLAVVVLLVLTVAALAFKVWVTARHSAAGWEPWVKRLYDSPPGDPSDDSPPTP